MDIVSYLLVFRKDKASKILCSGNGSSTEEKGGSTEHVPKTSLILCLSVLLGGTYALILSHVLRLEKLLE